MRVASCSADASPIIFGHNLLKVMSAQRSRQQPPKLRISSRQQRERHAISP